MQISCRNMKLIFLLSFYVILSAVLGQEERDWTYTGEQGPDTWSQRYQTCGGSRQSPIDVTRTNQQRNPNIRWKNYDVAPVSMKLENEGYTVQLTCTWNAGTEVPSITYNGIQYNFDSLHFHWGQTNLDGTEHSAYNRKYALEMHMVHRQTGTTGNTILVLGTIYDITFWSWSTILPWFNPGLATIVNSLPRVQTAHTETDLRQNFPLQNLLPSNYQRANLYTYNGSLTTPPCTETVQWVIFYPLEYVTPNQLNQFRALKDEQGNNIKTNVRPLQPKNNRVVIYYTY